MQDSKSNQEVDKDPYEEYVRDPIACGYKLIEKDGKQYYSKTFKHDNVTITLNRPVFTPTERKKREKEIMDGLCRVFRNHPELCEPVED